MYGIDISSWQSGLDLSKNPLDFVIMKATEGTGLIDRCFNTFAKQATELGLLTGAYHFARPDLHGTIDTMRDEAQYFIQAVEKAGLLFNSILVLDWETEPIDRPDLIKAWLEEVKLLTGVTPFIYGSKSKLVTNTFKEFITEYPVWIAAWPTTAPIGGCRPYVGNLPTSINWDIWQFSARGVWPNFNYDVDCDYTQMTEYQWKLHTYQGGVIDSPENPEIINEDMQWAIDNKLFIGATDGKMYPERPITRSETATVLRRFYNLINK